MIEQSKTYLENYFSDHYGVTPLQNRFLVALRLTGNVSEAARAAETCRTNHYRWLTESEPYREAFADAYEQACDLLELEARRRAVDGVRQVKFHQGVPIQNPLWEEGDPEHERFYSEHAYSDQLLITLLKAHRPERYSDRVVAEVHGALELDRSIRDAIIASPAATELMCRALEIISEENEARDSESSHSDHLGGETTQHPS